MAGRKPRPGRTLVVFFLALAVAYGLVALGGKWKPELGLDLQGGTRITLIASGHPSSENLNEARSIIDQRVNGSGVAEASVTTQGSNLIVVEIPGKNRQDLVDTVQRQAQMRFRLVACQNTCASSAATGGTGVAGQRAGLGFDHKTKPAAKNAKKNAKKPGAKAGQKAKGAASATSPAATPTVASTPAAPTDAPTDTPTAEAPPTGAAAPDQKGDISVEAAVAFMNNPPADQVTRFDAFTCPTDGSAPAVTDDPSQPLITCDDAGVKYLLSPAIIEGTQLSGASAGIPQGQAQWQVNLSFHSAGRSAFADATGAIAGTGQLFAIVLDGQVISAATASSRINGDAQITGNFTQEQAQGLATSLKYGSLPIAFDKNGTSSEVVGPTLAGNQLNAGLIAGAFGLGLVMLYCLFYYRGLGIVVISSLLFAAAWTYAMVLLLSKTAGFTLTLPGIAGLIIAVGITADSFIIFFERIRDEMREGRSMRVAVETGWVRAKRTRIGASFVSLFSAAILYIFATGVVKGFGFALGLSTIIDLAVLFWFTKPLVSWFARFHFFNGGGALSGLSPETLGIDSPATAGGKA